MPWYSMIVIVLAASPLAQGGDPAPSILEGLRLPTLAAEARRAGVAEAGVRALLDRLRRGGVPADEAAWIVGEEVESVRTGAPTDQFGGFVRRQLEAGLRGRDLAEAIRAEHRTRRRGDAPGRPGREQDTLRPGGRRP
ncbi:MAG: hypothetical protein WD043_11310 [Gemmatimonadales bacterium]